jgi:uncharacterized membrane protein
MASRMGNTMAETGRDERMDWLHSVLNMIVDWAILLFELMGVLVIVVSGAQGIWGYVTRNPLTRLNLAKGMAMGLEFKLGSEILRTVVVREFTEIFTVAGIILLRAALTFLIHWEIRNEEAAHSGEEGEDTSTIKSTSLFSKKK